MARTTPRTDLRDLRELDLREPAVGGRRLDHTHHRVHDRRDDDAHHDDGDEQLGERGATVTVDDRGVKDVNVVNIG